MSKALDLLEDILVNICLYDSGRYKKMGPGQVILSLPTEKREILAELTSEELSNIRPLYY